MAASMQRKKGTWEGVEAALHPYNEDHDAISNNATAYIESRGKPIRIELLLVLGYQ